MCPPGRWGRGPRRGLEQIVTYRRRSSLYHLGSIPRQIWRHPNNRGRKLGRLGSAVVYQLRRRLGVPPATVPLGRGLRVHADRSFGGVSNLVYFGTFFEYDELRFCERYLRPGDVVVDGGANIGLFSLLASRWVGDSGRVLACEPASRAAAEMRRNILLNDIENVELFEAALGETAGHMSLIADMDVSNQLVEEPPEDHLTEQVRLATLTEVLDGAPCALAKLDLEGAEMAALRGARPLLAEGGLPLLLLEAWDHQLRRLGTSREELLDYLSQHGYRFATYDSDAGELLVDDSPRTANFLAVHESHLGELRQRLDAAATRP